jgi:hypothetical protein
VLVGTLVTVVIISVGDLTGVILLGRFWDALKKEFIVDCCFGVWDEVHSSFSSKTQIPTAGELLEDVSANGCFMPDIFTSIGKELPTTRSPGTGASKMERSGILLETSRRAIFKNWLMYDMT